MDYLLDQGGKAFETARGPASFNGKVLALDPPQLAEPLLERRNIGRECLGRRCRGQPEEGDSRQQCSWLRDGGDQRHEDAKGEEDEGHRWGTAGRPHRRAPSRMRHAEQSGDTTRSESSVRV
jgi:hypothetical protein